VHAQSDVPADRGRSLRQQEDPGRGRSRKCGRSGHRICASPRQTGSLSYRSAQFSRINDRNPKPNRRLFGSGKIEALFNTNPAEFKAESVILDVQGQKRETAQRLLLGLRRWSASLRLPQGDPHSLSVCVTRHRSQQRGQARSPGKTSAGQGQAPRVRVAGVWVLEGRFP